MSESAKMGAFVAAIVAPLLGVGCATTELVPLVPSEDGVAVVQEAQLELKAGVQPGENSVPNTLTPITITLTNRAPQSVHVASTTSSSSSSAFAVGEIASGATEEGLVYFATPSRRVERLRLVVRVRTPEGHGPVATIEIPYAVKS